MRMRHRIVFRKDEETEKIILATLLALQEKLKRSTVPIGPIHKIVHDSHLSRRFVFVESPITYSVQLTNFLEGLVATGKLDQLSIFDDGNTPQTVYRFTTLGIGIARSYIPLLPNSVEKVASEISQGFGMAGPDWSSKAESTLRESLLV